MKNLKIKLLAISSLVVLFFLYNNFTAFGRNVALIGYIDRVLNEPSGVLIEGWACVKGLNSPIEIRIFAGGQAGIGVFLKSHLTHLPSSDTIHVNCQTAIGTPHRFRVQIPVEILKDHLGKLIFIHGINPKGNNLLISNSGKFAVPDSLVSKNEVKLSYLKDIAFSKGVLAKDPKMINHLTGKSYKMGDKVCPEYQNTWSGVTHRLNFGNQSLTSSSDWTLGQWDSQVNLLPSEGQYINEGTFLWENPFKSFQIGRIGFNHRTLTMGVNGYEEYEGQWREKSDPCFETPHPHLLVEQTIPQTSENSMGKLKKLLFTLNAKVLKVHIPEDLEKTWNMKTHTAHFKVHFNFQNMQVLRKSK